MPTVIWMFKSCFHFNRFEIKREGARARLLLSGNGKKKDGGKFEREALVSQSFSCQKKTALCCLLALSLVFFQESLIVKWSCAIIMKRVCLSCCACESEITFFLVAQNLYMGTILKAANNYTELEVARQLGNSVVCSSLIFLDSSSVLSKCFFFLN